MTEEEAKTKWCPMVRHTYEFKGALTAANRTLGNLGPGKKFSFCIGSGCMMWRKIRIEKYGMNKDGTPGALVIETNEGYCGLAGKP